MAQGLLTFVRKRGGLADLSQTTVAIGFETDNDLIESLAEILASPPDKRRDLAQSQWRATLRLYSHARFARQLKACYDELP